MAKASKKEQYQEIVQRVLKAMGYEKPTYGDFRLWDGLIDWRMTANLMNRPPIRTALCHILDRYGNVVKANGKPVVVARNIEAGNESEAVEILKKSSHIFLRWWPSDSPKRSDAGENQQEGHNKTESEQCTSEDYRSRTIAATRDFFDGRKRSKQQVASKKAVQGILFK
ncbi:MAG: hypothetical protein GY774_10035 [Planctomycetes bacterium]|nr:hypothetical protein [Planctomycetota bacterium]